MIDYSLLNLGMACQNSDEFGFCYEDVRDNFFDEIGGNIILEKKAAPVAETPQRSKLTVLKNIIARNGKFLLLLGAAIVGLVVLARKIQKKKDMKTYAMLQKKADACKVRYEQLKTSHAKMKKDLKDCEETLTKGNKYRNHYNDKMNKVIRSQETLKKKYAQEYRKSIKGKEKTEKDKIKEDIRKRYNADKKAHNDMLQDASKKIDMAKAKISKTEKRQTDINSKITVLEANLRKWGAKYNQTANQLNQIAKKYKLKEVPVIGQE